MLQDSRGDKNSSLTLTRRLKYTRGHLSADESLSRRHDSIASSSGSGQHVRHYGQSTTMPIAQKMTQHMPCYIKVKIVALGDVALCCIMTSKQRNMGGMHASRARLLKLDVRYQSSVGETARCRASCSTLGMTAGCFIDRTLIPTVSLQ